MKHNVLIVEDDPSWLEIFHAIIGNATDEIFHYTHVTTLASAVAEISGESYSLVLLDLMLPDSTALNTIDTISEKAKDIPVIVLSTLDDEMVMAYAVNKGIDDYLVKDQYDVETFLSVSRNAVDKFLVKSHDDLNRDLDKIIQKLVSLDFKLEDMQKSFANKLSSVQASPEDPSPAI